MVREMQYMYDCDILGRQSPRSKDHAPKIFAACKAPLDEIIFLPP